MTKIKTWDIIEAKIALTEQFIERKKREYDELVAELNNSVQKIKSGQG